MSLPKNSQLLKLYWRKIVLGWFQIFNFWNFWNFEFQNSENIFFFRYKKFFGLVKFFNFFFFRKCQETTPKGYKTSRNYPAGLGRQVRRTCGRYRVRFAFILEQKKFFFLKNFSKSKIFLFYIFFFWGGKFSQK